MPVTPADIERLSKYTTELYARMSAAEKAIAVQGEADRQAENRADRLDEQLTAMGAVLSEIRAQGAENAEQLRHLADRMSAMEIPRTQSKPKGGPWGTITALFSRWTPGSFIVSSIVFLAALYFFFGEPLSELIAATKGPPPG